jgi:hypothetical protein
MKTTFIKLLGGATLAATVGLSPALLAAQVSRTFPKALTIDGQIEIMKVGPEQQKAKNDLHRTLGLVTANGMYYELAVDPAAPKAFQEAEKMANRDDWFRVQGILEPKSGVPRVRVESVHRS